MYNLENDLKMKAGMDYFSKKALKGMQNETLIRGQLFT